MLDDRRPNDWFSCLEAALQLLPLNDWSHVLKKGVTNWCRWASVAERSKGVDPAACSLQGIAADQLTFESPVGNMGEGGQVDASFARIA